MIPLIYMTCYIDQSGKIEDTSKPTILALSNNQKYTILLSSTDKKILQELFRKTINKERIYVYQIFSTLLFMLLKNSHIHSNVVLDREYPGKESIIIKFCKETCRSLKIQEFNITFGHAGKSSNAHNLAYKTFKGKLRPNKKVSLDEVLEIITLNNKKRPGIPVLVEPRALKRRMVTTGR